MGQGPDIGGLKDFAGKTDRELTRFFVGREEEIELIAERARSVARNRQQGLEDPAAGSTFLITGGPRTGS